MKVEVLKTFGSQKIGSIIELSEKLANPLIKKGILQESNKKIPEKTGKITEKNIQKKQ